MTLNGLAVDTEKAESTEKISHGDTETQSYTDKLLYRAGLA